MVQSLRPRRVTKRQQRERKAKLRKQSKVLKRREARKAAKVEAKLKEMPLTSDVMAHPPGARNKKKKPPKEISPLHIEANELFRAGKHEEALLRYTEALEAGPDEILLSNRAACYIALEKYMEALQDADAAINVRPGFFKAHYRRAVALQAMGNLRQARTSLRRALRYSGYNPFFRPLLENLKQRWLDDKEKPIGPYAPLVNKRQRPKEEEVAIAKSVKKQRPNALGGNVLIEGDSTYSVTLYSSDFLQVVEMSVQTVGTTSNCMLQITTGNRQPKPPNYALRDEKIKKREAREARRSLKWEKKQSLKTRVSAFNPFADDVAEKKGSSNARTSLQKGASQSQAPASAKWTSWSHGTSESSTAVTKKRQRVAKVLPEHPIDPKTGERIIPKPLPKSLSQKKVQWKREEEEWKKECKKKGIKYKPWHTAVVEPRKPRYVPKPTTAAEIHRAETGRSLTDQPDRQVKFHYGQTETEILPKDEAVAKFKRLFHEKTGVTWENRSRCCYNPELGAYSFPNEVKTLNTR